MRLCYKKLANNFGNELCDFMKIKGVSKNELARAIGVSEFKVGIWCSGKSLPNGKQIIALADYFKWDCDYFVELFEQSFV